MMQFPLFEKFSLYQPVESITTDHTIYFLDTEAITRSRHFANTMLEYIILLKHFTMNRKLHEPFTLSRHDKTQNEINEMMIAIKLHHMNPPEKSEKPEQWAKAQAHVACPTWENVLDLLNRSYREMNECRYNPVKY